MMASFRYLVVVCIICCIIASVLPVAATELPASFSGTSTLTTAESPYALNGTCTIQPGAEVTIQPGVQIVTAGMYYIDVRGLLRAEGTETQPITIGPPAAASPGTWGGLRFLGASHGRLDHCVIQGANTNVLVENSSLYMDSCILENAAVDGLLVYGDARLDLLRCVLRENGRRGLYIEGTAPRGGIWRTHFVANGEYPVYLKATCAEMLRRGNYYEGNGIQRIGVSCSATNDIVDRDVWYAQDGIPFDIGAGTSSTVLSVSGDLTLDRGVCVLGTAMDFTGKFYCAGTAEQPVSISSRNTDAQPGDWVGIVLRDGAQGTLSYTRVQYAETGVWAEGTTLSLNDCEISSCRDDGLRAVAESTVHIARTAITANQRDGLRIEGCTRESIGISNCNFSNNGRYPVLARARDVSLLQTGNEYAGNGQAAIGVDCSDSPDIANGIHSWTDQGLPLHFGAETPTDTMLQIAADACLAVGPGIVVRGGGVTVLGTLDINGNSSNRVAFDGPGVNPAPGSWAGLYFGPGSNGQLAYVDIVNAVHGIDVNGASPNISNCTIMHSQYDGLRFAGDCSSNITRTAISANGRYGVNIAGIATPILGNTENSNPDDDGQNDIWANGTYEVLVGSSNDIYAQNNYWGTSGSSDILDATWDRTDNPACGTLYFQPICSTSALSSSGTGIQPAPIGTFRIGAMSIQMTSHGGAELTYTVSMGAAVKAEIRNIAGNVIRTLDQSAQANTVMRLYWDGRSTTGTVVPPGRYIYSLTAYAEDGRCCRSMSAFNK